VASTEPVSPTRRAEAASATKKAFEGKRFKPGKHDCAQMVMKFHLRAMGRPVPHFAQHGPYSSIAGGVRQLRKLGYVDLIAAMDAHFPRIPPARASIGDVIALPGEAGPGAVTVALGNGRVLGYHQEAPGACVLQPTLYHEDEKGHAAWRIE